jgi:putative heme-binding domain-containing protein
MRPALFPILVATATLALAQRAEVGSEDLTNPFSDKPEAVEAGRRMYLISCSGCHGPNGEGGRGIKIAGNGMVRGAANRRLFDSIKNGVRGSDMPVSNLPDEGIWQIITFVKSINASAYDSKPGGDVAAGESIFDGKGRCRGCHMIRGTGGKLGPDLSHIGVARSIGQLREAILKPSERLEEGFTGVAVTTKKGAWIEGVVKDNTNYSIAMMDTSGKLHLLAKNEVAEIVFKKKSIMPDDYGEKLTKSEFNDLVSFLSRQAVRIPEKGDSPVRRRRN